MIMENTWPGRYRHAMGQDEHKHWNAQNYPGTLQICARCDAPTGRCEDDTLYDDDDKDGERPICLDCWDYGGGAA